MGTGAGATTEPSAGEAQDLAHQTTNLPTTPLAAHQTTYFFKNSAFEFVLLASLGRAYYQGANIGKVLFTIRQIEDGNFDSAYRAMIAAGDEARLLAENSADGGHTESARQAYLWTQSFYDSAIYFADGTGDPMRVAAAWQMMDDCWLKSIDLFDPPVEQISIPYEGVGLRGFYFRGKSAREKRPLLILVNGSDGSALDMWMLGAAGATARGYDCLTFDGPDKVTPCGSSNSPSGRIGSMLSRRWSTLPWAVPVSIRRGSRSRASARPDTGFRARLRLRSGSPPPSLIPVSAMFPNHGRPRCRLR